MNVVTSELSGDPITQTYLVPVNIIVLRNKNLKFYFSVKATVKVCGVLFIHIDKILASHFSCHRSVPGGKR